MLFFKSLSLFTGRQDFVFLASKKLTKNTFYRPTRLHIFGLQKPDQKHFLKKKAYAMGFG